MLGQDFYFKFPHLSLPTLAAYTPAGVSVEIVDEKFHPLPEGQGYDLVGITAMTPLAPKAYRIADTYRRRGVPVVMGGYHPTVLPDEALEHADSVCIGEAETLWSTIVTDAMAGRLKERYRSDAFPCLDNLPAPRRELLRVPRSRRFEHINVHFVQTTRGCPFRCSFCAVTSVLGGKLRHRPVAEIEAEIEALGIRRLERGQKRDRFHNIIFFTDDNIVGDRGYSRELLRMVATFNLKWVGQASTNVADHEEILGLLRDSGCMGLAVGFETLSQKNIRDVGKGVNRTQEYLERIRKIHSYGIGLAGNFIFGFDHDDAHDLRRGGPFRGCGPARRILLLAPDPVSGDPVLRPDEGRGPLAGDGLVALRHGPRRVPSPADGCRHPDEGLSLGLAAKP